MKIIKLITYNVKLNRYPDINEGMACFELIVDDDSVMQFQKFPEDIVELYVVCALYTYNAHSTVAQHNNTVLVNTFTLCPN